MGQKRDVIRQSAQLEEGPQDIGNQGGAAIVGRFSQDRPLPNDGIGFHFEPAGNMLMSAATYKIIDDNGLRVRNEKTKRVREIFHLFGVEDPTA